MTEPLPNLRLVAPTEPPESRDFEFVTTHQVPVTREHVIPPTTEVIAVPAPPRGASWYARVVAAISLVMAIAAIIAYTSR